MRKRQMCLNHHCAVVGIFRIGFKLLCLLNGQLAPVNTVSSIDFLSNQLYALAQWGLQIVQRVEVVLLLTSLNNCLGKLQSTLSAILPVFR